MSGDSGRRVIGLMRAVLLNYLLVERSRRVSGDRRDGERVDETDWPHQLLHPSQLALVLRVGELDDEARRRALSTHDIPYHTIYLCALTSR